VARKTKIIQTQPLLPCATCPQTGDAPDVVIEGALAQTHTPEESIVARSFALLAFASYAHYYIKIKAAQQPPNG
jgi:hypothetical protein